MFHTTARGRLLTVRGSPLRWPAPFCARWATSHEAGWFLERSMMGSSVTPVQAPWGMPKVPVTTVTKEIIPKLFHLIVLAPFLSA